MINKYIDHTLLKVDATKNDIENHCKEALKYKFKSVMVHPSQVHYCREILKQTDVKIGTVIGFPLGQNTIETKIFEIKNAIKNGVNEIDYVINISELKNKNYKYIKEEMKKIILLCLKHKITSKVIIETCYLTKEEKIKVLEIIKKIKPDYVKTSTGFGSMGATIEDIKLIKSIVENTVKIKASGGIRDLITFNKMIKAGAKRIGTSSGVKIIKEKELKL